ncbi:hypothetical protein T07_6613 [Trichinella nelsoni]|uniref:Uncharacterized protein n=1 Tax=Trichinella nelsoni TaxID=6336 RepID=A0A0V0SM88_9BILA|nr:hypothetical protein T07_6613 [Trichinella nelsoni]
MSTSGKVDDLEIGSLPANANANNNRYAPIELGSQFLQYRQKALPPCTKVNCSCSSMLPLIFPA